MGKSVHLADAAFALTLELGWFCYTGLSMGSEAVPGAVGEGRRDCADHLLCCVCLDS